MKAFFRSVLCFLSSIRLGRRLFVIVLLTVLAVALLAPAGFLSSASAQTSLALTLSSPSHPDENAWYQSGDPAFTWSLKAPATYSGSLDFYDAVDVTVAGNYAYVVDQQDGLKIIDISNPASPALAGSYKTSAPANSLALKGNYAFLAEESWGIQIVNVSDPSNATMAAYLDTPGIPYSVAIDGDYAYVADGESGLQVINISDPAHPTLAGSYDTPGTADHVAVSGSHAYVTDEPTANAASSLQILDISDPSHPSFAGSCPGPPQYGIGSYGDLAVKGDYVYLAGTLNDYWVGNFFFEVIDVSDPASPALKISFNLPRPENVSGYQPCNYSVGIGDIKIYGDTAYITQSQTYTTNCDPPPYPERITNTALQAIDISHPENPVSAGIHQLSGSPGAYPYSAAIMDNHAFIASGSAGLQVIELNDHQFSYLLDQSPGTSPDNVPEGTNTSVTYSGLTDGEYYFHVAVVDGSSLGPVSHRRVRVATGCGQKPAINVSNPHPFWASYADYVARDLTVDYQLGNSGPNGARNLSISGIRTDGGVTSCNSVTCDSPVRLSGSYDTAGNATDVVIDASGHYAYVADGPAGLQILDVSDPDNPVLAGSYDTPGTANSVALSGHYAYVADDTGLQIIDVSNPGAPAFGGSFSLSRPFGAVAVSGNIAWLSDPLLGEVIALDVGIPSSPSIIGGYRALNLLFSVSIDKSYLYVAERNGIEILDVSNPAAPALAGSYHLTGDVKRVDVSGNHAYMAVDSRFGGTNGLSVVDVTNPASPALVGSYSTGLVGASGIAVSGNHAYLTVNGAGGLLDILDVSNPANPQLTGSYGLPANAESVFSFAGDAFVADSGAGIQIISGLNGQPYFPLPIGDLAPGESRLFTIRFIVPEGISVFHTQIRAHGEDICGNGFDYGR